MLYCALPDIQPNIAFITTHVFKPNKDNWKKLLRLLQYLNSTRDMCLMINSNDLNVVHWWVDATYRVHNDLKSHTGATMSIVKGSVTSISRKQTLTPQAQLRARSFMSMIPPHKLCGRSISFRTKGSVSIPPLSTKITKAPYYWKKMNVHQAQTVQNTSTSAIFLYRTALTC